MKGIILAGGSGSRLLPLTKVTNKHLLPVGQAPMIFHPVKKLTDAGITDILIVTGSDHMGDVVRLLGSGRDFGCEFTYRVQDQAGGIAEALGLAHGFARGEKMVVLLGDNIFEDEIGPYATRFAAQSRGARVLLKEVPDPQRYGVVELRNNAAGGPGRIVRILEKPAAPPSAYAVTGIYFYDERVFDIIRTLRPSGRGELEITDVNNAYLERGELSFDILSGSWTDAGTHESLRQANALVLALASRSLG